MASVGLTFLATFHWVSILKELRSLPPSSMCTLWTLLLDLSILDVPFPILLSTLIRSRFQAKPATLLIPVDFSFLFAVEELYGTRYQCGSFSLINVGSGFDCLRSSFYFLLSFSSTMGSCLGSVIFGFGTPVRNGLVVALILANTWPACWVPQSRVARVCPRPVILTPY